MTRGGRAGREVVALAALCVFVSVAPSTTTVAAQAPVSAQEPASAPREAVPEGVELPTPAELFRAGERAERTGDVPTALDAYRGLIAHHTTSRLAARASERLRWLEARASDPDALGALLRFQHDVPVSVDDVEAFTLLAAHFEDARVKRESLLAIASAWDRLAATDTQWTDRAADAYEAARNAGGWTDGERQELVSSHASVLARAGRTDEAELLLATEHPSPGSLHHRLVLDRADRALRPFALAVLAAFAALVLVVVARSVRAGLPRPSPSEVLELVLTVAFTGLAPWGLALAYSVEAEHLVGAMAPALTLVLTGSALTRLALTRGTPRWLHVAAAVAATLAPLAVGYLALFGAGEGPLAH